MTIAAPKRRIEKGTRVLVEITYAAGSELQYGTVESSLKRRGQDRYDYVIVTDKGVGTWVADDELELAS
jgi:hypothetical protein